VLIGISGSGKSSWAAAHFEASQIVSSDRLRGVVGESEADQAASADAFAIIDMIVAARLRRALTTVIDSTGLDSETRRGWRELAARHGVPCVAVIVDTPAVEARRRNAARDRRVPGDVISQQATRFSSTLTSLPSEGFDQVITAQPVRVVAPGIPTADATRPLPSGGSTGPGPRRDGLRFGLQLSSFGVPQPVSLGERLRDVAVRAEAAGFDSLWVMDHMRQLPQLGRPWEDMPEAVAALGFLAAATSRVTVGCLVHCVTYRNVGLLAKSLATLDVLSGGRAWCGLGAGSYQAEHLAYGWPFPPARERLDLLEDALQALPLLWGPGAPGFTGRRISVPEAMSYPRPVAGSIPILVGGGGARRTLRLVAQYADASNLFGDPAAVADKVAVLHRHCREVGRDPAAVEVSHLSTALVARDAGELQRIVARRRPATGHARWAAATNPGTVEDHVLRVKALRGAGVDHVIVALDDVWSKGPVETYAEVIAACRR